MAVILQYISGKLSSVEETLKLLKVNDRGVCYVTFNKSCGALQESFSKQNISSMQIYYIDGISATVGTPNPVKNCKYVPVPYDLKAVSREIDKVLDMGYTFIIFDSISDLFAYGSSAPAGVGFLSKFITSFSGKLKEKSGDAVFFCDVKYKEKSLIEETLPFFDEVVGDTK